jgi:hypothetical protein
VNLIQVNIFTVAASECHNLVVVNCVCSVESLGSVVVKELDFRLPPDAKI